MPLSQSSFVLRLRYVHLLALEFHETARLCTGVRPVRPVPGVVFVMVRDGEVFFKKGYGYADVEARIPVDPDETLFQVASVSKLFTATAVMQVAEQGRVDLHTDVNQYLRQVEIEDAFGEPVTLAHLLTHTGGFDERNIGYIAREEAPALGAYLAERMAALAWIYFVAHYNALGPVY